MYDLILILVIVLFSFAGGMFFEYFRRDLVEKKKQFNSLNIPQPKFEIGETVHDFWKGKTFKIENINYSVIMRHWYYYDGSKGKGSTHREDQLKRINK